jgi:RDD family
VYIAPDGSYTATYPTVLRRLGAGTVDWLICGVIFLLASIVGGVVQGVGSASIDAGGAGVALGVALIVLSQLIVAAPVVAYFAAYWTLGSTLGMRALDIELVEERTGLPPTWKRTIPRAIVAFLVGLAALNVLLAYGSTDELGSFERALVGASVVVVALAAAAKAPLLIDPSRRSALDRLFGLVYVEELVYSDARPSPWVDAGR